MHYCLRPTQQAAAVMLLAGVAVVPYIAGARADEAVERKIYTFFARDDAEVAAYEEAKRQYERLCEKYSGQYVKRNDLHWGCFDIFDRPIPANKPKNAPPARVVGSMASKKTPSIDP